MRIAIIGYPGAGKSTLANALAGVLKVRPTASFDELLEEDETLVLDGLPETPEDLTRLDKLAPHGLDRALFLDASAEIRLRRVSRMVVAGIDAAAARERMLRPPALRAVRTALDSSGRLTTIDANRSRTDVMASALEALGIRV